jgi:hypothetical protein
MYSDGVDSVLISFLGLSLQSMTNRPVFSGHFLKKYRNLGSTIAPKEEDNFRESGTPRSWNCRYFADQNSYIVINSVELHNMLYSLCKNLHEQTLSFAAADEIENPTG